MKREESRVHQQKEENVLGKALIAGSVCAVVAGGLNGIDVAKIRQQNQLNKDYNGLINSLRKIYREEGIRGLGKGVEASMWREVTYSSVRIGGYEPVRRALSYDTDDPANTTPLVKFFSALLCGSVGSALANPLDLVKTRFQAVLPNQKSPYTSTFNALTTIFRKENGFAGLYRGWIITCSRASVLNSAQLGSYDSIKHNFLMKVLGMKEGFTLHLCASMAAGIITTTAANPCKNVFINLMFLCRE